MLARGWLSHRPPSAGATGRGVPHPGFQGVGFGIRRGGETREGLPRCIGDTLEQAALLELLEHCVTAADRREREGVASRQERVFPWRATTAVLGAAPLQQGGGEQSVDAADSAHVPCGAQGCAKLAPRRRVAAGSPTG